MSLPLPSDESPLDDFDHAAPPAVGEIAELESRQDEILRQLDSLNSRLEALLAECGGVAPTPAVRAA